MLADGKVFSSFIYQQLASKFGIWVVPVISGIHNEKKMNKTNLKTEIQLTQ